MNVHATSRLISRLTAWLGLLLLLSAARAASPEAFSAERFRTLQEQGEPILVEISAEWCPVCKAQEKVLNELYARDDIQRIHWFKLDWDAQRQAAKDLGAWRQSTLVLFRGTEEVGRLVAQTSPDVIAELLEKAVEN